MWGFKYSNNTGVLPWGPSGPQFYVQLLHWCENTFSHTCIPHSFLNLISHIDMSIIDYFWYLCHFNNSVLQ
jgi:hypothetical protein